MESYSAEQLGKKPAFDFYNGYLTVIYGLLVTNGLQYVVTFTSAPNNHKWDPFDAFLFLGTFLTSLHFWFVCATVDDLSQDFYRILAGEENPCFDLLLLFDALVATVFAGFVLAMFLAIPPEQTRFFLWFLCAAGLSLLYDFCSRISVSYARRGHEEERERDTIQRYGKKVSNWIKEDVIFVIGATAFYFVQPWLTDRTSVAFGSVFAVCTLFLLLMDVELWTIRTRHHG